MKPQKVGLQEGTSRSAVVAARFGKGTRGSMRWPKSKALGGTGVDVSGAGDLLVGMVAVSYTHLTLPTICSV
eukprot:14687153-Alexandrium_andersonii.AAC.1